LLILLAGLSYAQVPQIELDALVALYNSTDGANWTDNTGWMGAAGNECSWFGVAAMYVAEHSINTTNVDLIGLSQTGVEYILMTWAYYAQKNLIYMA
jgi:hypothetical protein